MLSRREILKGAAVAGAAALVCGEDALFASASQPSTPVNFNVPANACDTHVHVFGDPQHFPLAPARAYTPEQASIAEMKALHRALHTERGPLRPGRRGSHERSFPVISFTRVRSASKNSSNR